jgi:DNA-directed RNA polymerase specialized sigma24 family protein
MGVPGPPTDDARPQLEKDAKLRRGVLAYAYKVTHRIDEAKTAAQEAFARVLEGKGWYAWHPQGDKTLFAHLCSVVDTVVANERARAHNRREDEGVPAYDEKTVDPEPRIDQRIEAAEEHQEKMKLAELVMQRLDEMARGMLELEQQGTHDAALQAEFLSCSFDDVFLARKRVAYHRDAVLAEHAKKRGRE